MIYKERTLSPLLFDDFEQDSSLRSKSIYYTHAYKDPPEECQFEKLKWYRSISTASHVAHDVTINMND